MVKSKGLGAGYSHLVDALSLSINRKEPDIKQVRLGKGLSREEVCKRLAIPYESLVEIENGTSNLPKWCLCLLENEIKRWGVFIEPIEMSKTDKEGNRINYTFSSSELVIDLLNDMEDYGMDQYIAIFSTPIGENEERITGYSFDKVWDSDLSHEENYSTIRADKFFKFYILDNESMDFDTQQSIIYSVLNKKKIELSDLS